MTPTRIAFTAFGLALLAGSGLWFALVNFVDRGGDGGDPWVDTTRENFTLWIGYLGCGAALLASIAILAMAARPESTTARRATPLCLIAAAALFLLYVIRNGFG